jgi:hypothetical protein
VQPRVGFADRTPLRCYFRSLAAGRNCAANHVH